MTGKFDVYSYFWNEQYGIGKIEKEEISWKAKLVKLNKKKEKAKEEYVSWFKNAEGITYISLCRKYEFLKKILLNYKNTIPKYSILIEVTFKLKKPYLSKDDDNFYIIDNPIVKDKVFKLPMVRATTWKGALRFASRFVNDERKDEIIVRLFGNEKGEESNFRQGRLFFYPTFFDEISLDVITPLSRETKTPVRGPIYFEIVPEGAEGIFRLLYYPFDLIARGEFDKIEDEMKEDLEFLSKALQKMFYEIGFSAKKSSGFGVISEFDGEVTIPFKKIEKVGFKSFDELNFSKLCTKVNKIVNDGVSK